MKTIITCCFFLLLSTVLFPQSVDKSKAKKYQPDPHSRNSLMKPQKEPQSSIAHLPKIHNNYPKSLSYLEQPERFPLGEYGTDGVPIALPNSELGFAYWGSYVGVYFTTSPDTGRTWSDPVMVAEGGTYVYQLTGLKTNSGRVILIWQTLDMVSYNYLLKMAYTDDLVTWYVSTIDEVYDYFYSFNLSCTNDNKLWLCYSRQNIDYTDLNLYYIASSNNGASWSGEVVLRSGSSDEWDGTIVSGSSNDLILFYSDYSTGNSDIFEAFSYDWGYSWSSPHPVINSLYGEFAPKVIAQPGNILWLFYYLDNPTTLLSGYSQRDIQYVVSSDGGINWGPSERFTYYSGEDYDAAVTLLAGQPFLSFYSSRWYDPYSSSIWYGLIGNTQDSNPPPALINFTYNAVPGGTSFIINAFTDDESGITDVKGEVFVNNVSQGIVQMYDDGLHNDVEADDYIWGTNIDLFNYGDIIQVRNLITDIDNNTVNVSGGQLTIGTVHDAGDLVLSLYSNSQLAEMGASDGTSAYWHGFDYLYLGGLWIGADVAGQKLVMDLDYSESDWYRTSGSAINLKPGLSDQDCEMTYDDGTTASSPIGLTVHQKSYQWSTQGYDDFIIFEYVIKNRMYSTVENLYASVWLDPDICSQTNSSDDLGGYDPQRGMIYVYDPQNNPSGCLGLRMLSESPSTAYLYSPYEGDPSTDEVRYQYMTSGIMPDPTDLTDYRSLLTSQPFSLAPGDSHTVAFGIVMGDGLEELLANADTMQAKFHRNIVGVDKNNADQLPASFNLAQNFPNPFNPATKISWQVPAGCWQTLKVYDVLGNEIAALVDEYKPAGSYEIMFNASSLPSGVYFYQLRTSQSGGLAGDFVRTMKMILLK